MADKERGRRHRGRWLIAGAAVIVLLAWGAFLASAMVSAYHDDKNGLAGLQTIKSDLTPGTVQSSGSAELLDQAHAQFASASRQLSSPLFAPVSILPVLGRQFQSVKALSAAAATVSRVGSTFLTQVRAELDQPHSAGPERVASLRTLASISAEAGAQLAAVDTGPSQQLIGPLAAKHNQFVTQLDDAQSRLSKAAGVAAAVGAILQGPQNYVVLASNNAEMQAGSGIYLDVGSASSSDGSLHLGPLTPSGDHPVQQGAVAVTGDLQRNWGWLYPTLDMRNLGVTPQFDVIAPLAARMWRSLTGQQVGGVIAVDVAGLQQLLEASGPVQVAGMTIGADNVEQYLLHDQYTGLSDNGSDNNDREDVLGSLAEAAMQQLQSQSADLTTLATSVSRAVAGRHLTIWSSDPTEQAAWAASGASGSLTARSVDISLVNLNANKLDQYVPVGVTVGTRTAGSSTDVTLTVHVANDTPPGQSQVIGGPYPGNSLPYGSYAGLIVANIPGRASRLSINGAGQLVARGAEGPTWVLGSRLVLLEGGTATVTFRFRLPGTSGSMDLVPSARIPAERWTFGGRTVEDTQPVTIAW